MGPFSVFLVFLYHNDQKMLNFFVFWLFLWSKFVLWFEHPIVVLVTFFRYALEVVCNGGTVGSWILGESNGEIGEFFNSISWFSANDDKFNELSGKLFEFPVLRIFSCRSYELVSSFVSLAFDFGFETDGTLDELCGNMFDFSGVWMRRGTVSTDRLFKCFKNSEMFDVDGARSTEPFEPEEKPQSDISCSEQFAIDVPAFTRCCTPL